MPSVSHPNAFILMGGFGAVCRNSRYLVELASRGVRTLLITPGMWRAEVAAALQDPDHPAHGLADVAYVDGNVDSEGVFVAGSVAAAMRWRARYTLVGVASVSEVLVEPAGLLADALGLPGAGLRASRACRSKYLQRWYLPEWSPASVTVPAGDHDCLDGGSVRFPAVVKPAGRHSSDGVAAVESWDELRDCLAGYSAHETVLVEERIHGQEFSVESLVQNGRVLFSSVSRKETTESVTRRFVELAHSVPSDRDEVNDKLLTANAEVIGRLDFGDGIVHSEWRVTEDGRPYLMEVAARAPGDGLLALYHLSTGEPMEPQITRIALGEPAAYPSLKRYTRQVYLPHAEGVLADVTVDWPGVEPAWVADSGVWPDMVPGSPDDPPTLRAVLVLQPRGSVLSPLNSSDDRSVTFMIDARTPEELDALEARVRAAITLDVQPSRPGN
ncbi:ATP-grasp domain-containing protein [Streptomyces eurythermus]|uniref:ATP-grasp domain-containing protein n=1 Tax=Streptomyces eurythermus TaxID=42237 RepID=UPI003701863D